VASGEGAVAGGRLGSGPLTRHDGAQLAPGGDAEVERGADPLPRQRQAVPRRVAHEEHAVLGRRAQAVREPVALEAHRVAAEPLHQRDGRLPDVVARDVGADPDAPLARRRHRPGVAATHDVALDPDVEVDAAGVVRMDLEATGDRGVGRLHVRAPAEHPPPAERVDDQRRGERAAVGDDRLAVAAALDLRDLEARRAALLPQRQAQLAVVECAPAPGQPEARGPVRSVERHARELLADRPLDAHRVQPWGRRGAGARGAFADLVAVDDEHVGAGAGELARHREAGEARPADQHVGTRGVGRQRRALGAAEGGAAAHPRRPLAIAGGRCHGRSPTERESTS